MAPSTLASAPDVVVALRRRDVTIPVNTLHTADHQALLRDLTATRGLRINWLIVGIKRPFQSEA